MALVSIIAAVARNGVIGAGGSMPWRLSSDMQRFRRITMGKPVVMGRKTYESIGRPLAGRHNIVLTRQPDFRPGGVDVAASLDAALALADEKAGPDGEAIVAGGGEIYAAVIDRADRLYITHVDASPEGDVRFPGIDPARWRLTSEEHVSAGERDSAATAFSVYDRIR